MVRHPAIFALGLDFRDSLQAPWRAQTALNARDFFPRSFLLGFLFVLAALPRNASRFVVLIDSYRYFHHLLTGHVLNASHLPSLLSTIRANLFPRNALPPPAPEPPTPEQQIVLKRHCAESLAALFPEVLGRAAGLSREDVVTEVESELDVWSDAYLNKHLAYQLVDLVVVRVLPELAEKGIRDLMEARGIAL